VKTGKAVFPAPGDARFPLPESGLFGHPPQIPARDARMPARIRRIR